MAGNAKQSDFAATTPWDGVQNKPTAFKPEKHRSTHGPSGDDPVLIAIEQVIGLAAQLAAKVGSNVTINGHRLVGNVLLTKSDIGLGQVDNTSDMNKPVSTAQQAAIDAVAMGIVPVGGIIPYGGAFDAIPSNWHLCDGTDGTPDLSAQFILGTSTEGDVGTSGGTAQHKHAVGTLANDDESSHTHDAGSYTAAAQTFTGSLATASATAATPDLVAPDTTGTGVAPQITATGSNASSAVSGTSSAGSAHTHTITGKTDIAEDLAGSTADEDVLPPWYKLAFIQRMS